MRVSLFASAAFAGALLLAGAAQAATVYDLTYDHCTGGCGPQSPDFGTVTVSDDSDGVGIDVLVNLVNDNSFTNTGLHAFTFDLTGTPTVTLAKLTSGFTFDTPAPGTYHQDGFGAWPYAIEFASGSGGDNEQTTLSFEILGAGTDLGKFATIFNSTDNANITFTADIWSGTTGKTGPVGAGPGAPVPEPASWALMLLGVGGLGAALRASRSRDGGLLRA